MLMVYFEASLSLDNKASSDQARNAEHKQPANPSNMRSYAQQHLPCYTA
jgi:hypothetical protein